MWLDWPPVLVDLVPEGLTAEMWMGLEWMEVELVVEVGGME